jgi:hypothetical protein
MPLRFAPLALLLVSCVPVPIDDFCPQLAQRLCQGFTACCTKAQVHPAGCVAFFEGQCRVGLLGRSYTGTAAYRPALGAQCIAELEAVSKTCTPEARFESNLQRALRPCLSAVEGTLAAGADCSKAQGDCAPGLFCNQDDVCTAFPKAGEECEGRCERDAVCAFKVGQLTGTCTLRISEGEACDPAASFCEESTYCDSQARTCQLRKDENQPCVESAECASADCQDGVCTGDTGNCTEGVIP